MWFRKNALYGCFKRRSDCVLPINFKMDELTLDFIGDKEFHDEFNQFQAPCHDLVLFRRLFISRLPR